MDGASQPLPSSPGAQLEHVDPPELTDEERRPDRVEDSVFYDAAFEGHPPRRLRQVWNQQGNIAEDVPLPSDEEAHQEVLDRLREDPNADWRRAVSEKDMDTPAPGE
ncbi:hypothetical protein FDH18_gp109 [Mycobacterium phage Lukilu]|uniref:Uncharacterized protein n=2 Tax=Bixzunavirus TaxID=680114 RepID=A0A411CC12_9CAUD|nr:hypothetical protein FDH18_gp109 [Mycobacterium phage Lukilu]YP_010058288.1 hypothetical protein KHO63_gp114 [Mycobacterium phage QBert]APD17228.1 hypothetical protein SEA_LUKILU_221 [Mycobacterium phage Lukilu]QAY11395.1 hypothetical protein SEA_QBERT_222 [Mycobacterium phage QBert]